MRYLIEHRGGILALLDSPLISERYTLLDRSGRELPSDGDGSIEDQEREQVRVREIGFGGFGSVVRVRDGLKIHRAMKMFDPQTGGKLREVEGAAYRRELEMTNAEPFKNVLRIMDFQLFRDVKENLLCCYVMDLIEGLTLKDFFTVSVLDRRDEILASRKLRLRVYELVFNLLDQMVAAIKELHSARIVHLDIKPANFLVKCGYLSRSEGQVPARPDYELFLTDLGGAKKLCTGVGGRTGLMYTAQYFPDKLKSALAFDGAEIDRQRLENRGYEVDLFSFGRTLEEVFLDRVSRNTQRRHYQQWGPLDKGSESKKADFWRQILGQEYEVLEMIIDELLLLKVKEIGRLAESLGKVSRTKPSDLRSSEILTDIYPGFQHKVPQELVTLADPLRRVAEHPCFRRLKHLNQLSLIYEMYPGATHSRYVHSILTFGLTKRLLLSLGRSPQFRYLFNKRHIDTILCAALLHDVGQYPFAHSVEDLREAAESVEGLDHLLDIRHDHELVRRVIKRREDGGCIGDLLDDVGVSEDDIVAVVSKKQAATGVQMEIGREIINSTIDVDRISYLRLDSYMTGVPFGNGIDVDGLLENLIIKQDGFDVALGVEEDGVSAAEMILTSVYWMYQNVYWHQGNRLLMAVIKHVVDAVLREQVISFDQYFDRTFWMNDREALSFLNDLYRKTRIARYGNPVEPVVAGHRPRYQCLLEVGYSPGSQGEIWEGLVGIKKAEQLTELQEAVADLLSRERIPHDPAILWDIPLKPRLHGYEEGPRVDGEKLTGVHLWVRLKRPDPESGRRWVRLREYSGLARIISEEEDRRGRRIRLFVNAEAIEETAADNRDQLEAAIFEKILELVRQWTHMGVVARKGPKRSDRTPESARDRKVTS